MVKLLNALKENGMIWLYLGSLISADSLLCPDDCDRVIKLLNDTINAIPETDFTDEDKEKILEYCKNGIEICEADKKEFLKNIN